MYFALGALAIGTEESAAAEGTYAFLTGLAAAMWQIQSLFEGHHGCMGCGDCLLAWSGRFRFPPVICSVSSSTPSYAPSIAVLDNSPRSATPCRVFNHSPKFSVLFNMPGKHTGSSESEMHLLGVDEVALEHLPHMAQLAASRAASA